jgi:large conductance mechanosensitive channel
MSEEKISKKQADLEKSRAAKSAAAKAAATARKTALQTVTNTSKRTGLYGFTDFIREQGVVGIAIGLVFAAQVKVVVDQFLASFVNPILGLLLPGGGDLSQKKVTLTMSELGKTAIFNWGQFVYVLMSFILTALIIYYVFKSLKLEKFKKQA